MQVSFIPYCSDRSCNLFTEKIIVFEGYLTRYIFFPCVIQSRWTHRIHSGPRMKSICFYKMERISSSQITTKFKLTQATGVDVMNQILHTSFPKKTLLRIKLPRTQWQIPNTFEIRLQNSFVQLTVYIVLSQIYWNMYIISSNVSKN